MKTTQLMISGMTCGHCAQAVTRSLQSVAGVQSVQVDLAGKSAQVVGDASTAQMVAAVVAQGYGAQVATA